MAQDRLRVARDVHDVLGHNLALIALNSELAAQLVRRGQPGADEYMLAVRRTAQDSMREVRDAVGGSRNADLESELAGARSVLRSAGVGVRVIGDGSGLPSGVQSALGWVVREATTNIIRHSEPDTVKIELADDENLIRSALAALLGLEDDLQVVAQAATGDQALALARVHRPDVAVLDLQMPGLDGIAVAAALRAELPECASVIVTSHGRPGHLKRPLAAGAGGFLPKTVSRKVLTDVLRVVALGGRYVDSDLAAEAISAGDGPLTPREADVLELAADGAPIDEIARKASLSSGTVRNYLSTAVSKLGAANRHEAVHIARTHGWI